LFDNEQGIAQPGDYGAFITVTEWLDVIYGSVLRRLLADGLGGTALHVIDPKARSALDGRGRVHTIVSAHVDRRRPRAADRHAGIRDALARAFLRTRPILLTLFPARPSAVGVNPFRTLRRRARKRKIDYRYALARLAPRADHDDLIVVGQVDLLHRHLDAQHLGLEWHVEVLLEHRVESPLFSEWDFRTSRPP
jgi:hypothetical protein